MPMPASEIKKLLNKKFDDDNIDIIDSMGNQDYYHIIIKSNKFQNLSKLQQHKMVYQLLGDAIGTKVHSITLTTEIIE